MLQSSQPLPWPTNAQNSKLLLRLVTFVTNSGSQIRPTASCVVVSFDNFARLVAFLFFTQRLWSDTHNWRKIFTVTIHIKAIKYNFSRFARRLVWILDKRLYGWRRQFWRLDSPSIRAWQGPIFAHKNFQFACHLWVITCRVSSDDHF